MKQIQALRGFTDLYPREKALQQFVFSAFREVARQFGFEEYDGPIVEPVSLYANKSSEELLEKQTFQIKPRGEDDQWILRPEMTPTLARMVAAKSRELIFPLRYFNIGPRFRYEAPQKGRSREFWQADFDILGSNSVLSDAEILVSAISILKKLGFTDDEFEVKLNSRLVLQEKLMEIGVRQEQIAEVLQKIDRMDKSDVKLDDSIKKLVDSPINPSEEPYFKELFAYLKEYNVDKLCSIDFKVVRGLDYYTGLVFEIKKSTKGGLPSGQKNGSGRITLLGGGRYANLISNFEQKSEIAGVGYAVSDTALLAYLTEKNRLPDTSSKSTEVLVTVFNKETVDASISAVTHLRSVAVAAELYPETDKKLDKQLKYADRNNIPYVLIIGPEEVKSKTYKLKNLKTKEQQNLSMDELIKKLI